MTSNLNTTPGTSTIDCYKQTYRVFLLGPIYQYGGDSSQPFLKFLIKFWILINIDIVFFHLKYILLEVHTDDEYCIPPLLEISEFTLA